MLNVIDGLMIGLVCGIILEKFFSRRRKLENNIQFPKPPAEYYRQVIQERRERQASIRNSYKRSYFYEENEPLYHQHPALSSLKSFRRDEESVLLPPSFMQKIFKSQEPKEGKLIEVDFENKKRKA
jgi:hypothetical protein